MDTQPEMLVDCWACWMARLETLWELEAQFEAAERRWRRMRCEPKGCSDPETRQAIAEARQCYQEAGLAFYLAAAGERLGHTQNVP